MVTALESITTGNVAEQPSAPPSISKKYTFPYPWELCVDAFGRRFPKHPRVPVIHDSKIISDEYDEDRRIRKLKRRVWVIMDLPGWVKKIIGYEYLECVQINIIDSTSRSFVCESANETLSDKFAVIERITITANTSNPGHTDHHFCAFLTVHKFPMKNTIEKIAIASYRKNTKNCRDVDFAFIQDVLKEGHWEEAKEESMPPEIVEEEIPPELEEAPASTQEWIQFLMTLISVFVIPNMILAPFLSAQNAYRLGIYIMLIFLITHQFYYNRVGYARLAQNLMPEEWLGILEDLVPQESFLLFYTFCLGILHFMPSIMHLVIQEWPIESSTSYCLGAVISFVVMSLHAMTYSRTFVKLLSFIREESSNTLTAKKSQESIAPISKNLVSVEKSSSKNHLSNVSNPEIQQASTDITEQDTQKDTISEDKKQQIEEDIEPILKQIAKHKTQNKELFEILEPAFLSNNEMNISIPFYIYRLVQSNYAIVYPIVISWNQTSSDGTMNVSSVCIERTYQDFKLLSKSSHKVKLSNSHTDQQYPPSLHASDHTLGSKKEPSDKVLYVSSLEARRISLENFTSKFMKDQIDPANTLKYLLLEFLTSDSITKDMLDIYKPAENIVSHETTPPDNGHDSVHSIIEYSVDERRSRASLIAPKPSASGSGLSGVLSFARWSHSWKDFYYVINQKKFKLFEPNMRDSPSIIISLEKIHSIIPGICAFKRDSGTGDISGGDIYIQPLPNEHFLTIRLNTMHSPLECYISMKSLDAFEEFIQYLQKTIKPSNISPVNQLGRATLGRIPSLYACPSLLDIIVLNKRVLYFEDSRNLSKESINKNLFRSIHCNIHPSIIQDSESETSTLFSTWMLEQIFKIYSDYVQLEFSLDEYIIARILEFSKLASLLSWVDLSKLSKQKSNNECLMFYLNIYHTLLIHSTMELGRPEETSFPIRKFLDCSAYDICGYVYSLSDLETLILRSSPLNPEPLLPKGALIKMNSGFSKWLKRKGDSVNSKDPRKLNSNLEESDPRINFVLNHGTMSCPRFITIFDSKSFEQQLARASAQYLMDNIQISSQNSNKKITLFLPMVLQWYIRDFGTKSSRHLVKELINYMPIKLVDEMVRLEILKYEPSQPSKLKGIVHRSGYIESDSISCIDDHSILKREHTMPLKLKSNRGNPNGYDQQQLIRTLSLRDHHSIDENAQPESPINTPTPSSSAAVSEDEDERIDSSCILSPNTEITLDKKSKSKIIYRLSHRIKIKFLPFNWTPRMVLQDQKLERDKSN